MNRRTALRSMFPAVLGVPALSRWLSEDSAPAVSGGPAVHRKRYRIFADTSQEYSARAIRLVQESTVVDMLNFFRHADYRDGTPTKDQLWLDVPDSFTEEDFDRYRSSGMNVLALGRQVDDYEAGLRFFARWNGFIASHARWFMRVDTADDFDRARREGKVGIMLTFQNSEHFRAPDDVEEFHRLGQRLSQLTYNYQNRLGAGFLEHRDGGLTVFGHSIVERMNQVGMAVDLSHCGDRTTLDAIRASTQPVLFTHASCRALVPGHLRCKTDEAIQAMAATGGVMGIHFVRFMIRSEPPVTVEHVLDHFDHVVRLVGVEHVGIGSDLDMEGNGTPRVPPGEQPDYETLRRMRPNLERYRVHLNDEGRETISRLDHPKRVFDLTEGLVRRGYSDDDIALMLGGNFRRALGEIW